MINKLFFYKKYFNINNIHFFMYIYLFKFYIKFYKIINNKKKYKLRINKMKQFKKIFYILSALLLPVLGEEEAKSEVVTFKVCNIN